MRPETGTAQPLDEHGTSVAANTTTDPSICCAELLEIGILGSVSRQRTRDSMRQRT